jgi:hypothetical protein
MSNWILSVRGWLMSKKLRGKKLRDMLDRHWMTLLSKDEQGNPLPEAPTAEEFRIAVESHNAQYEAPTAPTLWGKDHPIWGRDPARGIQDTRGPLQQWQDGMREYATHKFNAEQWRRERQSVTIAAQPQTDWTCDAKDLTSCPVVGEPIVEVPRWMYEEWICLAGEVETEWITYLIGEMRPAGAIIETFYFPPQVAGGAHVAQPDDSFRALPRTIGATHSHVRMAAFWSGTDEKHANWPVEIVVNAKGESKCRVRLQLECHRYARIDSKIKLTGSWQRPSEWRTALEAALKAGEDAKALAASAAAAPASASPISGAGQPDSTIAQDEGYFGHYFGRGW